MPRFKQPQNLGVKGEAHPPAEPDPVPPVTAEEQHASSLLSKMMTEMPRSNTPVGEQQTGLTYQEIAANARKQLGSVESARKRVDPTIDKFSPTDRTANWKSEEAQALYNDVGPGRSVSYKRKPGEYAGDRDEIADIMYRIPEAKIVTRKSDGESVQSWDTVLISYPDTYENRRILEEFDNYNDWAASIDQETIHGSVTERHPRYEDMKKQKAEQAQARSRSMGVGVRGVSPGAGYGTFEEGYKKALSSIPIEETRALEDRERRGGRHLMHDEEETEQRGGGGRQQFGGLAGNPRYNKWDTSKDRADREKGRGR